MNMQCKIETPGEGLSGNSHWHLGLPYRAIVPVGSHPTGAILYQVAGSNKSPCGAEKAFRESVETHGAKCYYCEKTLAKKDGTYQWTLDHIEPIALGGKNDLANFVVACQPCNVKKSHMPIDAFCARATAKWLTDLRQQIDDRLNRLLSAKTPTPPPSQPRP
jgi:HNH endonuclease